MDIKRKFTNSGISLTVAAKNYFIHGMILQSRIGESLKKCCEHVDKISKQRCSSRFALEKDHIVAVALGGSNDLVNLQLLCRAHNSRRSIKTFGVRTF